MREPRGEIVLRGSVFNSQGQDVLGSRPARHCEENAGKGERENCGRL